MFKLLCAFIKKKVQKFCFNWNVHEISHLRALLYLPLGHPFCIGLGNFWSESTFTHENTHKKSRGQIAWFGQSVHSFLIGGQIDHGKFCIGTFWATTISTEVFVLENLRSALFERGKLKIQKVAKPRFVYGEQVQSSERQ